MSRPFDNTPLTQEQKEIVEKNYLLIGWAIKRFMKKEHLGGCVNIDDLREHLHFTIIRLVRHFDPSLGFKFSTYAGKSLLRDCFRFNRMRWERENKFKTFDPSEPVLTNAPARDERIEEDTSVLHEFIADCKNLTDAERFVIELRAKGKTLKAIAERRGSTRENVRQIEHRAIVKLNEFLVFRKHPDVRRHLAPDFEGDNSRTYKSFKYLGKLAV